MKRLFVIQLFLSVVTPFYCVAQEQIEIDAFAGPFPYLYEVVQGYTCKFRISEERGRYIEVLAGRQAICNNKRNLDRRNNRTTGFDNILAT